MHLLALHLSFFLLLLLLFPPLSILLCLLLFGNLRFIIRISTMVLLYLLFDFLHLLLALLFNLFLGTVLDSIEIIRELDIGKLLGVELVLSKVWHAILGRACVDYDCLPVDIN